MNPTDQFKRNPSYESDESTYLLCSSAGLGRGDLATARNPAREPGSAASDYRAEAPNRDTSYIDAEGTAHVTRWCQCPRVSAASRGIF